jgi:hypothetical protein
MLLALLLKTKIQSFHKKMGYYHHLFLYSHNYSTISSSQGIFTPSVIMAAFV